MDRLKSLLVFPSGHSKAVPNSIKQIISVKLSAPGHRVQRAGIPRSATGCRQPLLSITYGAGMFGNRVACCGCVVRGTEALGDGTKEGRSPCSLKRSTRLT